MSDEFFVYREFPWEFFSYLPFIILLFYSSLNCAKPGDEEMKKIKFSHVRMCETRLYTPVNILTMSTVLHRARRKCLRNIFSQVGCSSFIKSSTYLYSGILSQSKHSNRKKERKFFTFSRGHRPPFSSAHRKLSCAQTQVLFSIFFSSLSCFFFALPGFVFFSSIFFS